MPESPEAYRAALYERIAKSLPDPHTLDDLQRATEAAIREIMQPYVDRIVVERSLDDPTRVDVFVPPELVTKLNALRGPAGA